MYATTKTPKSKIIQSLISLEAGNVNSYIVVYLGGEKYNTIQAKKTKSGKYHVELLENGGNPSVLGGIRVFAIDEIGMAKAIKLFLNALKELDNLQMPEGFRETTKSVAKAQSEVIV